MDRDDHSLWNELNEKSEVIHQRADKHECKWKGITNVNREKMLRKMNLKTCNNTNKFDEKNGCKRTRAHSQKQDKALLLNLIEKSQWKIFSFECVLDFLRLSLHRLLGMTTRALSSYFKLSSHLYESKAFILTPYSRFCWSERRVSKVNFQWTTSNPVVDSLFVIINPEWKVFHWQRKRISSLFCFFSVSLFGMFVHITMTGMYCHTCLTYWSCSHLYVQSAQLFSTLHRRIWMCTQILLPYSQLFACINKRELTVHLIQSWNQHFMHNIDRMYCFIAP